MQNMLHAWARKPILQTLWFRQYFNELDVCLWIEKQTKRKPDVEMTGKYI